MPRLSRLIVILLLALAVAACGNKGALVLPTKRAPAPAKKTETPPADPAKQQPTGDSSGH